MAGGSDVFENYVRDLAHEIFQLRLNAKSEDDEFGAGKKFALFEVLSLMQQQADAFGIPRSRIALPDRDVELE